MKHIIFIVIAVLVACGITCGIIYMCNNNNNDVQIENEVEDVTLKTNDTKVAEPEPSAETTEETTEPSAEAEQYYYEDYYYESNYYDTPSDGLTQQGGVNYYNGRTETWYSSNVLYHYRTGEWSVDNEGFYRTPEGYYVVAASDMEQGTTFEGSKGTCMVLDSGCDAGITDYYTTW